MTDAEWDALQHHLEAKQYRETFAKIQADFTAARAFDTAQLNLAITPTCVFALYVAARRSSTVEEFETISREMAKICEYNR